MVLDHWLRENHAQYAIFAILEAGSVSGFIGAIVILSCYGIVTIRQ